MKYFITMKLKINSVLVERKMFAKTLENGVFGATKSEISMARKTSFFVSFVFATLEKLSNTMCLTPEETTFPRPRTWYVRWHRKPTVFECFVFGACKKSLKIHRILGHRKSTIFESYDFLRPQKLRFCELENSMNFRILSKP